MVNILMNYKCPFLIVNKFCSHKSRPTNSHRNVCGYKKCLNCRLFLIWRKQLHINQNNSLKGFPAPILHTLQPTRPKRCKICKKILRIQNKSGYCSFHHKQYKENQK